MKLIKPPTFINTEKKTTIFLAGSIEMGFAEDWQEKFEKSFSKYDVCLLNPRRDNWDSSLEQTMQNPNFVEQVVWELDGQDEADIIAMYFDPKTKSPITLLELGLFAEYGKLIVCCPEGFWRKGNVDIVCRRYVITLTDNFDSFVFEVKKRINIAVN